MRGLVLGGTSSGVGKTVATLAAIRAFEDAGHAVQPAKAGPDFIDPSHHAVVADRPSRTLDTWLEGTDGLRRNYRRGEGDLCLVEGVMGLYDGDGSSTAMVAEALDLPVVLVVDAKAGMESVAATALGFREYAARIDRDIDVAGVIAQRAHGGRHADGIRDALPDELDYFGRIPPTPELEIPDRHLGLEMGDESQVDDNALATAADHLRVDALLETARAPPEPAGGVDTHEGTTDARIAVAEDAAFCFTYPATLERLRDRAEVVTFAPTAGDDLPDCDGVYLPGGYPELHVSELAASPALDTIGERASEGLPILGECGGLMTLSESLTTADGETGEMAGVLPAEIEMRDRYQALDHVELRATEETLTADSGGFLRGHEFHYSEASVGRDARFAFEMERGDGIDGERDGLTEYRTLGTYAHVHAESGAFDRFLDAVEL
ncbi:cobyrinic acid a,c-diamide synthase [Halorientalis sp. IM1011]|uniref:cobyrinic acid a,c-diamide synthase n=1 Tax=Halorientalis sp. IM1011 TaxID=1932360 RepID=UPI00097CCD5D|nr:cobyrinic acid a,c-diamide synthase [Halorientalis sp. IM1011]AQL44204.1 cobyrinic acid a,c-diamide synthase [Halorientalis sp. IM1011]